MTRYLLLFSKLQSFLPDEIMWLYFNKLILLSRQNFWCRETDKQEVKDKNCSSRYLSPGLFSNLLYAEVPNYFVVVIYVKCMYNFKWNENKSCPRQFHCHLTLQGRRWITEWDSLLWQERWPSILVDNCKTMRKKGSSSCLVWSIFSLP